MTNEMKLILALCDALGFDVETIRINETCVCTKTIERNKRFCHRCGATGITTLTGTTYKLTKKEPVILGIDWAKEDSVSVKAQLTPEGVKIMEDQATKLAQEDMDFHGIFSGEGIERLAERYDRLKPK